MRMGKELPNPIVAEAILPYDVVQRKGKWVVLGRDGHTFGTHPSKKKARAQQAALYAAEGRKGNK